MPARRPMRRHRCCQKKIRMWHTVLLRTTGVHRDPGSPIPWHAGRGGGELGLAVSVRMLMLIRLVNGVVGTQHGVRNMQRLHQCFANDSSDRH